MTSSHLPAAPQRGNRLALAGLLLAVIVVSVLTTLWVARTWLYPQPFQPVVLDARERATLDAKLDTLASHTTSAPAPAPAQTRRDRAEPLSPEPYAERPEDRVIHFSQRELNAMIARNPDLAQRLAIHLSDGMISASMLITLPPDFPLFSAQTVRVATGLSLRHEQGRPIVAVEGVSIMGVPLPSAWLGDIKGRDLVALHSPQGGFWQAFGEGVRDLRVEQGRLRVELAE